MGDTFRISVRELVSFSYFSEDILPAADMSAMLTGTLAHKARQDAAEGEAEVSLKHVFSQDEDAVLLYGRMDLFVDGEMPLIEEIKLGSGRECVPLPEHRAQAICYAAMLASEKALEQIQIRVTYVDENGVLLCHFEETQSAQSLAAEIQTLLSPFVAFARREAAHCRSRDESLRTLTFPFDDYRKGQRELAVQVYTAITRKKRLFASLPTGTGKSAAVLYPALKAMGEGKTGKVVYLTARNTARQSPLAALERMSAKGMQARCSVLTAKEKLCPAPTRCHPDWCTRAKGHYVRQGPAIEALLQSGARVWTDELICETADRYNLCPFEFALALGELADVLLMDLNYAFDPFAQVKRLFQRSKNMTLLVDEAHHTVDRVRESLSGELDSRELSRIRMEYGKTYGRKNAYYHALTRVIHALRALDASAEETSLSQMPDGLDGAVRALQTEAGRLLAMGSMTGDTVHVMRLCLPFLYAVEHLDEDYAILLEKHGRERQLTLYCLLPGKEIARVTKGLRGTVFFSATLSPLGDMKRLLGGGEEDACFALPSPFDPARLVVIRRSIGTRYTQREQTASAVAACITQAVAARRGNYIAYFPSYAYLELVRCHLDETLLPELWVQTRSMGEEARTAFLEAFETNSPPKLGLCVLGGLFSEGVDLAGDRLIGVMIVGVGLPTPSAKQNAIRDCYQRHFGDGFSYACRFPAMQKVLQAAGRVIRGETDKGMVLLLDDRYTLPEYTALLPPEWQLWDGEIALAAKRLEEIP